MQIVYCAILLVAITVVFASTDVIAEDLGIDVQSTLWLAIRIGFALGCGVFAAIANWLQLAFLNLEDHRLMLKYYDVSRKVARED